MTDHIYKTGDRETNEDVRGGMPLTRVGLKGEGGRAMRQVGGSDNPW